MLNICPPPFTLLIKPLLEIALLVIGLAWPIED
jgi:hypothetical protein